MPKEPSFGVAGLCHADRQYLPLLDAWPDFEGELAQNNFFASIWSD
jgi:hypothetical protein